VSAVIDAELKVIDRNYGDITSLMHDRKMRELGIGQQFVMTSYNNLALMLNEALEQMQQQMQSMMSGSGSCDKPGGKGQPSEGMGNMKDKLKEQLEKMKGQGDKPGEVRKAINLVINPVLKVLVQWVCRGFLLKRLRRWLLSRLQCERCWSRCVRN
jgi:hypothetical protein